MKNKPRLEQGWSYPTILYIDIKDELKNKLTEEELQFFDRISQYVDFQYPLILNKKHERINSFDELAELAGLSVDKTKDLFKLLADKEVATYRWMQINKQPEKMFYFYLNPYIFIVAKDVEKLSFFGEDLFFESYWADYNREHFKPKKGRVPKEKYRYRGMRVRPDFWDYKFEFSEYSDDKVVQSIVQTLNTTLKGHQYVSLFRYRDGAVILFSHSRQPDHPSVSIENDDGDIEQDIPRMRYIEQFQKECGLNFNIQVTYSGDRIKIKRLDN